MRSLVWVGLIISGLFAAPLLSMGAAHAAAKVEPGTLQGGEVAQTGWWNAVNEPPPDNPALPPPPPPAPDAPAGTLPVTVLRGEPSKISAIEFGLEGDLGSTVDGVELALKETAEPALTANAEGALITACKVIESYWVGGENNPWKNKPAYDCEAGSAKGVRDTKGVWRFDVTSLATDWLATDRTGSPSVVLVGEQTGPNGEPMNFQVVFEGVKTKGIGLAASTTPPTDPGDDDPGSSTPTDPTDSPSDPVDETDPAGNLGNDADLGDLGSLTETDPAPLDEGAPDLTPVAADGETPTADAGAPAGPVSATIRPWYDGLLKPAILLLPLILGLAYMAMVAMGPDAQPDSAAGHRGVSKALDRLRVASAGMTAKAGARIASAVGR
jgi:hypothetical protein